MNARVPPVPSRTNASTINTGIFISTSLTVVPDTVQVNRWASHCQPTLFKLTLTGSGPSLGAIVEVSRHSLIHAGSPRRCPTPSPVILRWTTGVLFRAITSPPCRGTRFAFDAKASPLETSRMAVIVAAAHVIVRNVRLMLVMWISRFVGPAPFCCCVACASCPAARAAVMPPQRRKDVLIDER